MDSLVSILPHVFDLFKLSGKIAVVTGGATGLGATFSAALAEAGANVVVCGRGRHGSLNEAKERIRAFGVDCLTVECDVAKEDQVVAMSGAVRDHFGRCDILVNNAGVTWGTPTEEMTLENWNKVIQTNLTGAFLCTREFGKMMMEQQSGGSIIMVSSVSAFVGGEIGVIGYSASKGGLVSMTKQLAVEWAPHGIRINAIAPGWFFTNMSKHFTAEDSPLRPVLEERIPMKRIGQHDDLKGAVVFLASEASAYVTGHVLVVDGGALVF
jgi:NAD(P)-dependent dehydrogenase (short-subunit alcohol dehydrogenase family)